KPREIVAAGGGERAREDGVGEAAVHGDLTQAARRVRRAFEVGEREVGGERRGEQRFERETGRLLAESRGREHDALGALFEQRRDEFAREREASKRRRVRRERREREARPARVRQIGHEGFRVGKLVVDATHARGERVAEGKSLEDGGVGGYQKRRVRRAVQLGVRQRGGDAAHVRRARIERILG